MTQHYIYKTTNHTTGEYYYGKRTCSSGWRDDPYMGSGLLLQRKMKAHPDHDWRKEVLLLLDSEEEAFKYEVISIGDRWDTDPLCLNLCPGGHGFNSAFTSALWDDPEYREKMMTAIRRQTSSPEWREFMSVASKQRWADPVYREMNSSAVREGHAKRLIPMTDGEVIIQAPRGRSLALCLEGWDYLKRVNLKHDERGIYLQPTLWVTHEMLRANAGWTLGKNKDYRKVKIEEAIQGIDHLVAMTTNERISEGTKYGWKMKKIKARLS